GGGSPGSPKIGCSSGVSALASSIVADRAPNSISVSLSSSAVLSRASILSDIQAITYDRQPWLLGIHPEFLFQVMNAGTAQMECRIRQQITVQRHIGLDAFNRHF